MARWLPSPARRAVAGSAGLVPTRETKVAASYKLMRFLRAASLPSREAHFSWNGTWLPEEASALLRPEAARRAATNALAALAARNALAEPPSLAALQQADIMDYLPNDILAKVDRMSMAHGLEVRAPFLDPSLAELALSLPRSSKSPLVGQPKRVLREEARRLFGPEIGDARKQGFSIPIHSWLRGRFRDLAFDLLSPRALAAIEALEPGPVTRALDAHMSGRRSLGWEIWGLMILSAWHRIRVASAPALADDVGLVRRDFGAERQVVPA
jgi:asparagine synthase (glutamine-hydrolysing)